MAHDSAGVLVVNLLRHLEHRGRAVVVVGVGGVVEARQQAAQERRGVFERRAEPAAAEQIVAGVDRIALLVKQLTEVDQHVEVVEGVPLVVVAGGQVRALEAAAVLAQAERFAADPDAGVDAAALDEVRRGRTLRQRGIVVAGVDAEVRHPLVPVAAVQRRLALVAPPQVARRVRRAGTSSRHHALLELSSPDVRQVRHRRERQLALPPPRPKTCWCVGGCLPDLQAAWGRASRSAAWARSADLGETGGDELEEGGTVEHGPDEIRHSAPRRNGGALFPDVYQSVSFCLISFALPEARPRPPPAAPARAGPRQLPRAAVRSGGCGGAPSTEKRSGVSRRAVPRSGVNGEATPDADAGATAAGVSRRRRPILAARKTPRATPDPFPMVARSSRAGRSLRSRLNVGNGT